MELKDEHPKHYTIRHIDLIATLQLRANSAICQKKHNSLILLVLIFMKIHMLTFCPMLAIFFQIMLFNNVDQVKLIQLYITKFFGAH